MPQRIARGVAIRILAGGIALSALVHAQQPVASGAQPRQPPIGTGLIAGRTIDGETGEGIAGVSVQLMLSRPASSAGGAVTHLFPAVLTDSQGRFVFVGLADGSYFPTVDRQDYAYQVLDRTIDLAPGARLTDINFRFTKLNSVVGTVRDDTGDPVVGVEVVAFVRAVLQGRPATFQARSRSRTDDRGHYRITQLLSGQYFICACTRDVIPFDGQLLTTLAARPLDLLAVARRAVVAGADAASLDSTLRTYAPTFYPNTPLASRAERVTLDRGETRTGVDITAATVRAVRVSGQIVGAPPSTISASSLLLVPVGDLPEASAITNLPPVLVQDDGRFDFGGVPPGTYSLEVNATPGRAAGGPSGLALSFVGARGVPAPPSPPPPPGGRGGAPLPPQEWLWASETISVGEEDVTGLVIGIQRGFIVRGKIEFSGSAVPPGSGRGAMALMPMDRRLGRLPNYGASINPDFTFEFNVPPGRYVVPSVPTFGAGWTAVKAVAARGTDAFDAPLIVDRDIPDLVVTMTDTPTQILGTVELPAGEIPDEWVVLVFPTDRRLWKEPFGALRRFNTSKVTAQRTFVPRLPPGEYYLSLNRGLPTDWMEAGVLEELAKTATSVTLVEGDRKAVQVKR